MTSAHTEQAEATGLCEVFEHLELADDNTYLRNAFARKLAALDAAKAERDGLYAALARLVDVSEAASSWPEYQSALADARTVLARTSGGAA